MAELEQTLSLDELREWRAYDVLAPIGPERLDVLMSQLLCLVASYGSKRPLKPDDFRMTWDPGKAAERSTRRRRLAAMNLARRSRRGTDQ